MKSTWSQNAGFTLILHLNNIKAPLSKHLIANTFAEMARFCSFTYVNLNFNQPPLTGINDNLQFSHSLILLGQYNVHYSNRKNLHLIFIWINRMYVSYYDGIVIMSMTMKFNRDEMIKNLATTVWSWRLLKCSLSKFLLDKLNAFECKSYILPL